ncbi:Cytochrome c, mono-and diheme variants [Paenibacillus sp. yr247]|nr:Cytochrome c, mono-and diheme variants [Paenibacillus sp. yr247]
MKKRVGAALVGIILVVAGCGRASSSEVVTPGSAAPLPSAAAVVSASPTASAVATPSTAASTATPAASSTPQPSAAATATPTAAVATAAPVKEAASAKPSPSPTPAPASAAPSPSAKPQATDSGTSTAAQAQVLYKDNCMACHGAGLAGDFGPNLTKVGSRKTKDEIVTQILGGKGDMPPFKNALKSEEIEALAAWLAAKK